MRGGVWSTVCLRGAQSLGWSSHKQMTISFVLPQIGAAHLCMRSYCEHSNSSRAPGVLQAAWAGVYGDASRALDDGVEPAF